MQRGALCTTPTRRDDDARDGTAGVHHGTLYTIPANGAKDDGLARQLACSLVPPSLLTSRAEEYGRCKDADAKLGV